jgi:hypothetical protein
MVRQLPRIPRQGLLRLDRFPVSVYQITRENRFHQARQAKEFLASQIVEEAQREGAPLSEIERKMLFFSECGWTLPDMKDVSDAFDREYDQSDYEKKITGLIERLDQRVRNEHPADYDE